MSDKDRPPRRPQLYASEAIVGPSYEGAAGGLTPPKADDVPDAFHETACVMVLLHNIIVRGMYFISRLSMRIELG